LKDGAILETGTHSELMALNGYYASLVSRQISRFDIESSPRAVLPSTPDAPEAEMPEPSFASSR
jgi:hypothetical protein